MKEELLSFLKQAEAIRTKAYAPYSKFHVGAAVLTASNKIYLGCNVENASYGLSMCAERNAIASAVKSEGPEMRIQAIAVAVDPSFIASPCGACRQVIQEFAQPPDKGDCWVVMNNKKQMVHVKLGDLLPYPFIL